MTMRNNGLGYGVSGNMSALGAVDVGSNPATLTQLTGLNWVKKSALGPFNLNIIKLWKTSTIKIVNSLYKYKMVINFRSSYNDDLKNFINNTALPTMKGALKFLLVHSVLLVKSCSLMDKALPFECKDMCSTHVRTRTKFSIPLKKKCTLFKFNVLNNINNAI